MANTLMFEVGVSESVRNLEKVKKLLDDFVKDYTSGSKALKLRVETDNLDAVTMALGQIGDSSALRNLRNEITAINREFSILSKGAGGTGSIADRGVAADIERTSQSIDRYTSKIKQLTEERTRLVGGTRNSSYQNYTDEILRYEQSLEGARRKLAQLNEQKNQPVSSEPLKKSTQDAQAFETALGRIETAISGLKSGMNVNLGQDFAKWAQEVQAVTVSVRELVEQLQKVNTASKPAQQGGIFDPQKFTTLQEVIDAVIREINRLKEAFSGIGEIKGMTQLTESMNILFHNVNTFKDVFSTLSSAVNLTPTSEYVKKLQTDFEAAQAKVQELTEKLTALTAAQNNVAESAAKAGKSEQQIGDSQAAMFNRYNKLLADIRNIKGEIIEIQRSTGGGGPFGEKLGEYFSSINRIRNLVREITSAPSVAEAIQRGMSSELLAKLNSALAALKTNYKEVISDAKSFNKATDKGSSQAEARIRKLGMAFNELKNYMKANGGSEEMRRLQSEIQGAIRKMRELMNAGNFAGAINVYERLSGIIRQAAMATKEFERSQQGLSTTISHTNSQLQGQSQILSDLKTMAMQYLSVWGAQTFIHNIIELGGQLEQQRLSIGAILQDTAQANHLFGQIKDLAIKSPFGVQQLDAMSKQLSAYGFQYSELYEWTKRLADISAATGTSVDRLALALGHVRAEGALSGYTLRQFSMGNIPLLQKLSENLGKTKQEIRKMTRNKEIGYEDVLNVLKQLTDEGGMFYEAQETMAQALNAKFKNLRDSFQIMYSEMAEGAPGDFLKKVAEVLTDISKSWRVLMPLILSGGAALGIWKLSTMALNHELERSGKLLVGNAISTSKYSMNQLRAIATTGRFTVALKGLGRALMSIGRFIFNPVTLGFAAVEGLIYLWSKHNEEVRKAADLTKAYGEEAVESEKNIAKQLENVKPFSNKLDDSVLKTGIDSMTESIKNYAINGQSIINGMFSKDAEGNVMSLADKYQYLRGELEETIKVYKELKRVKDAFEYGITKSDGGWLDDNVDTDLTQYSEAYKKFVDDVTEYNSKYNNSIEEAIEYAQMSDPAFREATKNMKSYGEMLAEFWSNPNKYQNAAEFMNDFLFGAGAGSDDALNLNESFFGYLNKKNEAMNELDQFIENTEARLKEKGYDFSKELAPEQVGALLKMSKDWLDKHPEWENIYDIIKEKLEGRWPIKIVPDASPVEEELPGWLQEIQNELDQKKTGIQIKAGMSMEQIIEEARKAYQTAETTINKLGPIAINAGIKIEGLTDEDIAQYGPTSKNYNPELYNTLLDLKKGQDAKGLIDSFGSKRGLSFKNMKKDGSHKREQEKKDTESAKAVRERVRVIKEAADAFQYWREKVGDKGAWEHVQSEFGEVLESIGITADNIEDVRGHLKKIPEMKEYKAIKDQKVKTEIKKEIAKEDDQFIRKDFERDTERFLSQTQIELDNLTRAWETFNSVREATGNIELAVQISGADYASGKTRNLADALKEKIQKDFDAAGGGIAFDMNMSDKDIEESIKRSMPSVSEEKIKGLVDEYKKWRDLQRDVLAKDIDMFAKLVSGAQDYDSKLKLINDKLAKQVEANNALANTGKISRSDADKANKIANVQAEEERWKISFQYSQLMNNSLALTRQEVESGIVRAMEILEEKMKANLISAQEYAEEMEKIRNIQSEWTKNSFFGTNTAWGAGIMGGISGRRDYYKRQAKDASEEVARLEQKKSSSGGLFGSEYSQLIDAKKRASNSESEVKRLDNLESVFNSFEALSKAMDPVVDLFDKLGMSGVGKVLGAGQNALNSAVSMGSGMESILAGAGPYGAAIGAGLSIMGSLIGSHDDALQEEIDELKANNAALEANTEVIKALRGRTLGYDSGELRRMVASQYADVTKFTMHLGNLTIPIESAAKSAMRDFYSAGLGDNGYAQELANLKQERENYLAMYDAEEDKKDSSEESLAEYKKKIAELDEEIMFFAQDLANELFSIDIKGWADQISDSLMTAFENGEDAAKSFKDTVEDIMKDVVKRMLSVGVIQPMMAKLQKKLFGENGQGGSFDAMNPEGTIDAALRDIADFFGEGGEGTKAINAAQLFYDKTEAMMNSKGLTLSEKESSNSLSSNIKGITEQTADLLAAYLNAVRADVSVNRAMIAQYYPLFYAAMTGGNASLQNIENHTAAIMRSNDAINRNVEDLRSDFHGLKTGVWKMPIA